MQINACDSFECILTPECEYSYYVIEKSFCFEVLKHKDTILNDEH